MSLQMSDLSLVRRSYSIGFCPDQPNEPLAFAEYGKLIADDHMMIM